MGGLSYDIFFPLWHIPYSPFSSFSPVMLPILISHFLYCASRSRSALYTRSAFRSFYLVPLCQPYVPSQPCPYLVASRSSSNFFPSSYPTAFYPTCLFLLFVSVLSSSSSSSLSLSRLPLLLSPFPFPLSFQERIWLNPLERFSRWRAVAQATTMWIYY